MSHHTIGIVMSRLLAGLELTSRETDLFIESDVQTWFWIDGGAAERTH